VALVSGVLLYVIIGIGTWIAGMFVLAIWAIYRITHRWLALPDGKPLPGWAGALPARGSAARVNA
jgi:type IV secretory pathway TrbD component